MHLRPTTATDIPRCVTVHTAAFESNEVMNFIAPNRAKYPLSWRQYPLKMQRAKLYQPDLWGFVCVADADDHFAAAGEILGYARWARRASKEDAAIADPWMRRLSVLERVEGWLCAAEFKWETTRRTNPAVAWARQDTFMKAAAVSTGLAPLRAATHWYVDSLCVAPEYQRRGVARMLLQWGLQRAKEETEERAAVGKASVPVTLIATAPGLHLYRSVGFKVVSWEDGSFLEAPAEGGSDMVWDPTGYWIEDVAYEEPLRPGVVDAAYKTRDTDKDLGSVS